ncbi:MAG: hypothetical protein CMJ49_01025 [Planctomycetaceae bacterium]|nr:hypothetical protein [Planctomycetaceae bacterium]
MSDRWRVVVVGLGSIGKRHARLLAERPDVSLEAVELDAEAVERARPEISDLRVLHPSFEAALSSGPDVVLIATPAPFHAGQTIAALEAGCHVLCEKPMSDNVKDAERMKAAAEKSDRLLSIGFSLHFSPSVVRFRDIVRSGRLGELVHINMHIGSYLTLVLSRSRHQARMEGSLMLDYAHQPDLLYWMLGHNPRGVYAAACLAPTVELKSNPNVVSMTYDYDEPLVSYIHLNFIQAPAQARYEAIGDQGWVHLDAETGLQRVGSGGWEGSVAEEIIGGARDEVYQAEHQRFFDAIDGKGEVESPPGDAIQSMYVIDAAIESWKTGKRVEL